MFWILPGPRPRMMSCGFLRLRPAVELGRPGFRQLKTQPPDWLFEFFVNQRAEGWVDLTVGDVQELTYSESDNVFFKDKSSGLEFLEDLAVVTAFPQMFY